MKKQTYMLRTYTSLLSYRRSPTVNRIVQGISGMVHERKKIEDQYYKITIGYPDRLCAPPVVLFTTKDAAPDQIKLKMLELSIRRRQSNFSTVYIFC